MNRKSENGMPAATTITFADRWTVFAPFEKADGAPDAGDLLRTPAMLCVNGKTALPQHAAKSERLDYAPFIGGTRERRMAFAYIPFSTDCAGVATIGFGVDWWHQAWIDGELVSDTLQGGNIQGRISPSNHVCRVELAGGKHLLVVRCISGAGGSSLCVGYPAVDEREEVFQRMAAVIARRNSPVMGESAPAAVNQPDPELSAIAAELDAHYATFPHDISAELAELEAVNAAHPEWLPYRRKASIYEVAAQRCPVKVFRRFPFYFDMSAGQERTQYTGGIGAWYVGQPKQQRFMEEHNRPLDTPAAAVHLAYSGTIDTGHHCIGYDNVLKYGLNGLIAKAQARLRTERDERERSFLESCMIADRALIALAKRFADEADRLLAVENDPTVQNNYRRIAEAARRVPAEPPITFYEALNTIVFMGDLSDFLEGVTVSTFGHIDRMLEPYLRADLLAGRITLPEAERLLTLFLMYTDVKGVADLTVVIGGCDADGVPVFNDITRAVIRIYRRLHLVNPKLNVRLSQHHPPEFVAALGDLIASGANNVVVYNDEVVIAANVKVGKALRDVRLYVGGGCQENILQNTEINSRCSIYFNLPQAFNLGLFPDDERWAFLRTSNGVQLKSYAGCADFSEFYARCFDNLGTLFDLFIARRNAGEKEAWWLNPCPLISSTLDDCIEKAKDMYEGGCRYSFGSVAPAGIGTLIDSLFAVRRVVFEEKRVTLTRLAEVLSEDFAHDELLRQYLVNRVPKFGQDDAHIRDFSAKVFADLAALTVGKPNGRGGKYEAGLMPYRSFVDMGKNTGATPDGRKAGEYFSPGMGPSVLSPKGDYSISHLLAAVEPLDMTAYASIGVLDGKLPWMKKNAPEIIGAVLRRFLQCGGSVLQLNIVDERELLAAIKEPEKHRDVIVRVSGYSARFVDLSMEIQEEIIGRTMLMGQGK